MQIGQQGMVWFQATVTEGVLGICPAEGKGENQNGTRGCGVTILEFLPGSGLPHIS